jgi:hypothetical protein
MEMAAGTSDDPFDPLLMRNVSEKSVPSVKQEPRPLAKCESVPL